ncbi:hypothetical protein SAMN04487995_2335 [Dyadobacter koreensis]|uniref:Outer membrane protein beta-barrel domain-containing protein n=1 Tax=Dyadobacter koreensis TaxID=408657 RepID=A0A1H6U0F7_9BACT|nr:hypothetical protein [Dyadobacter koreensis]SEI81462.1 hypothetical protein SAMN04487995_2335 [Dyadobacter koreensis]
MKKTLLFGIVSLLWLSLPVKAQLEKGTKYVAATINFRGTHQAIDYTPSVSANNSKYDAFNLNPSFQYGKFVKENRMIGIGFGTSMAFSKNQSSYAGQDFVYKGNNIAYNLSPYIRHYKSLSPKWAIFLNSSLSLSYIHLRYSSNDEVTKTDGYAAGVYLTPGISYWITPRFALETDLNFLSLSAGYNHMPTSKNVFFNSIVTTNLTSYFAVRASWYLQKN